MKTLKGKNAALIYLLMGDSGVEYVKRTTAGLRYEATHLIRESANNDLLTFHDALECLEVEHEYVESGKHPYILIPFTPDA